MLDLIRIAYNVDPERVAGGPSWLELDRFDLFAKTPETVSAETRRLMLQSLLAERFKLAVHNDSRPIAAYGLMAKNPHLKEASGEVVDAVGTITKAQVREIAEQKMKDLNANDIEAAMKMIEGSARSMGISVAE